MPALPQQISLSPMGTIVDAGNRRQNVARRLADALRVSQVAGVVIGHAHVEPVPRRPGGVEAGDDFGDVADLFGKRAGARPPTPDRAASSSPYPFIVEPQPAALTTTHRRWCPRTRRSAAGEAARLLVPARRAAPAPRSSPGCAGARTSQPSAASTRTVASLTWPKNTRCTQPVMRPTRSRGVPAAAVRSGTELVRPATRASGASAIRLLSLAAAASCSSPGSRRSTLTRKSGSANTRRRAGYGSSRNSRRRNSRSPAGR